MRPSPSRRPLSLSRNLPPTPFSHQHTQQQKQHQQVRQSQQRAATQLRRAELTLEELKPLPENAAVFRPLGRAYASASRADLVAELERACAEAREEASKLGVQAERAETQLRATEGELRELVRSAPEAAAALMRMGGGGGVMAA